MHRGWVLNCSRSALCCVCCCWICICSSSAFAAASSFAFRLACSGELPQTVHFQDVQRPSFLKSLPPHLSHICTICRASSMPGDVCCCCCCAFAASSSCAAAAAAAAVLTGTTAACTAGITMACTTGTTAVAKPSQCIVGTATTRRRPRAVPESGGGVLCSAARAARNLPVTCS